MPGPSMPVDTEELSLDVIDSPDCKPASPSGAGATQSRVDAGEQEVAAKPAKTAWRIVNRSPTPTESCEAPAAYQSVHGVNPTAEDSVLILPVTQSERSSPTVHTVQKSRSQRFEIDISAPWARMKSQQNRSRSSTPVSAGIAPISAECPHDRPGMSSTASSSVPALPSTMSQSGVTLYRDKRYSQSVASSIARGEAVAEEAEKHVRYVETPTPAFLDEEWPLKTSASAPTLHAAEHGNQGLLRESMPFEYFEDVESVAIGDPQLVVDESTTPNEFVDGVDAAVSGVPSSDGSTGLAMRILRLPEGFDDQTDLDAVLRRILRTSAI
ncbi:hypothetical protein Tdes44962_MAKER03552 [Teratosphaeria destructans]|uniref:Uncharacterized protein n=1 Tax=Teratosphaeria destructans TaxID=418781 RepID=A0A9W7SPJ7_9PEZI|nr:hypothetical protein Tdes44962_MAKER03552 [Teratosphaeria destructans]